ncbi:MAG: DsrE family protein [Sphingomonadales bacterium]|nr:DsrE family protein [Sphingomonadales bacterium]
MMLKGGGAALALAMMTALPGLAEPARVAIHVDEDTVSVMNMALNNAANIEKHYADKGEEVVVEIVTYGPGLNMLREDVSPVKDRIAEMALQYENLTFSACLNTVEAVRQKTQKDVPLIEEASVVPSGAVRLMELQQQGYAYLRP